MNRDKIYGPIKISTSLRLDSRILAACKVLKINKARFFENQFLKEVRERYPTSNNLPATLRDLVIDYYQDQKKDAEYWLDLLQEKKAVSRNELSDLLYAHLSGKERGNIKIWYGKLKKGDNLIPDLLSSLDGQAGHITAADLQENKDLLKMIIAGIAKQEKVYG